MAKRDIREQHIAVFGESGSGKTVLLSSFYGHAQEPATEKESGIRVSLQDTGAGKRLHQLYLQMKNAGVMPDPNRMELTSHTVFLEPLAEAKSPVSAKKSGRMRLVWHDYPGEWWEQEPQGEEEAERRVSAFRSLLRSDVAVLLVDGQRLLDNAGEEERYLKSLLRNFRNTLLPIRERLLPDGKPLRRFPRIWVLALSKADLLPHTDVIDFQQLLVEKAGAEIAGLEEFLSELVAEPTAFSFGNDYLQLSALRFEADRVEVAQRIGVDLIVPIATMLPFHRHARWVERKIVPAKFAKEFLAPVGLLASGIAGIFAKNPLGKAVAFLISKGVVDHGIGAARSKLEQIQAEAEVERDFLRAMLVHFERALRKGDEEKVLLRSPQ